MIVKTVGRGPDNNIVINDENVSRKHLQILQDDNGNVSVVDVGSTNGTYVNGVRITSETRLSPGDTLRIGNTALPWQTYFSKAQTPMPPLPPMRKKKWWIIGGGIVLVLLIVGSVLIFVNGKKEVEKECIEQEQRDNKLLMDAKDRDYKRLKDRKRKAELDAKAEKIKRAEEGRRHAVENQQIVDNKIAADQKVSAAETEKKDKFNALVKALQEKDSVEQKLKEANEKAEENARIAKELTETAQLKNVFEKELNKARSEKKLKDVCSALGINDAKNNDDDRYYKIVTKYNSAKDNPSRQKIIDTIKNTKKKTILENLGITKKDSPKEDENK